MMKVDEINSATTHVIINKETTIKDIRKLMSCIPPKVLVEFGGANFE